ncbi:hypothetical protein BDZ89DRAFT_954004 [Hymenopellis radicata]|nr:hypothetical protein BDZ89DRAFT_954004 [Hymenopellis radicata]
MSSPEVGEDPTVSPISFADADAPSQIPAALQHEKHFFGIRKQDTPNRYIFNDEYDKRFPDDAYHEEATSNAKVWRTYAEEAAAFDANMVGQSRDALHVTVFAGLFSAVVTSFLVQASQNLQADYGEMTAILLHDLVSIQLALADGDSTANITGPSTNPTTQFVADEINVWVNGFWAVSLTASLAVAPAAVLIKQWLSTPGPLDVVAMSVTSDSPASGLASHILAIICCQSDPAVLGSSMIERNGRRRRMASERLLVNRPEEVYIPACVP